ncbi:MAG: GLUG motif-containing protein [Dehalococcoidia bacterium]
MKERHGRRHHHSSLRLAILLTVTSLLAGTIGCDPAPDYLEIRTWYELDAVRYDLGGHYLLMNDLDSTTAGYGELAGSAANQGKGWQPIGSADRPFTGSFDGQGHEIRDIFVHRPDEYLVALFGAVDVGGIVQNVKILDANVAGEWAVGCLVGQNCGEVRNSYCSGVVTGEDSIGGLVGRNGGTVVDCHSTASVAGRWDVGGLVGSNESPGTIINSYSAGSVRGQWASGGLAGSNLGGTVVRSYSTGTVVGEDYVGGLVGDNQGGVSDCYSIASVVGQWYVGGLVGDNDSPGVVNRCYSSGRVVGLSFVGGLVGSNWATVTNSFWNVESSEVNVSDGGTGRSTAEMNDIATYANAGWNIVAVVSGQTDPQYVWNIVSGQTHPFLSWQV